MEVALRAIIFKRNCSVDYSALSLKDIVSCNQSDTFCWQLTHRTCCQEEDVLLCPLPSGRCVICWYFLDLRPIKSKSWEYVCPMANIFRKKLIVRRKIFVQMKVKIDILLLWIDLTGKKESYCSLDECNNPLPAVSKCAGICFLTCNGLRRRGNWPNQAEGLRALI